MPYYLILKQRRLDLNLSVQDIAIQTRLKPEYIRAIEDNNLEIFSDDFSYVRYFVHGYCDAIGVNWLAIKDEVDAQISAYAAARDQALMQAQMKMIQSMPTARPTRSSARSTRRRRKRSFLSNNAGKLSRAMGWSQHNRLASLLLIVGIVGIASLFAVNALLDHSAQSSVQAREQERAQELRDKEEQTQRLAQDLQSRKQPDSQQPETAAAAVITPTGALNTFVISGLGDVSTPVHFEIKPAYGQNVTILWNGEAAFSQGVSGSAQYDLAADMSGQAIVIFDSPNADNRLLIQDVEVPADYAQADEYGTCRIVLQIERTAAAGSAWQDAAAGQAISQSGADGTYDTGGDAAYVDPYAGYGDPGYADPNAAYGGTQDGTIYDPGYSEVYQ